MCFHTKLDTNKTKLEKALKVNVNVEMPMGDFNGFVHPACPIVSNIAPNELSIGTWGLLPNWGNADFKRVNTLNARIETLQEKPSFKNYISNRCIIPITSFYEWQWLDGKGKRKQKYAIGVEEDAIFCLAGIYTMVNGILTYTIVTTAANTLMASIHNTKKRMPVILSPENKALWLQGTAVNEFVHCDPALIATAI